MVRLPIFDLSIGLEIDMSLPTPLPTTGVMPTPNPTFRTPMPASPEASIIQSNGGARTIGLGLIVLSLLILILSHWKYP